MNNIIIGAGITGLSTAYHLKNNYLILEKENTPGGLCKSITENGFTFDYTGHLLHLRSEYGKKFVLNLLKNNIKKIRRNSWIYSNKVFTRYPFQANLYGLPKSIIKECIRGLVETLIENKPIDNKSSFKKWSINTFGNGFAKHFFIPYNEKLWKISSDKLTAEWVTEFVPRPNLEDVLIGAFQDSKTLYGYNTYFYYPIKGGIQSLINSISNKIKKEKLLLNTEILKINWKKKYIISSKGKIKYNYLISTIPLTELLSIIDGIPEEIKNIRSKLLCNSVYCFNIGIKRPFIEKNKHWVYFPGKEFIFYRVGFYHNFSKFLVPEGCSSVYVEVSTKFGESLNQTVLLEKVFKDLNKCRIIKENDKILTVNILPIKYAYIIYDKNREKILKIIQNFLKKNKIFSIGRFGAWKYSYIEESILDGKKTADIVNGKEN
ncbi:MAG: protoporphyrinogen/coproporphyrinogen oxidase [Endomicrobiia bacterium]